MRRRQGTAGRARGAGRGAPRCTPSREADGHLGSLRRGGSPGQAGCCFGGFQPVSPGGWGRGRGSSQGSAFVTVTERHGHGHGRPWTAPALSGNGARGVACCVLYKPDRFFSELRFRGALPPPPGCGEPWADLPPPARVSCGKRFFVPGRVLHFASFLHPLRVPVTITSFGSSPTSAVSHGGVSVFGEQRGGLA